MKLIIPEMEILENHPFQKDALNRVSFANNLTELIKKIDDPFVLSLNAPWGEGKTTFIKMWLPLLKKEGFHTIYFDAFANDYLNDAFIAIVSEITEYFSEQFKHNKNLDNFLNTSKKVGIQLLGLTGRIAIKAATMGVIKDSDIEMFQEFKEEIAQGSSELIGNVLKDKIENHHQEKQTIITFKKELSDLAASLKNWTENQSTTKLIIFIDELDRCRPSFAVEILEKIKHVFLTKNTVFVLSMHKKQLEEAVKAVYGRGIDANTYLQKFINVETSLPKERSFDQGDDYLKYIYRLSELHDFPVHQELVNYMNELANHFDLSLRQLEKVFLNIILGYLKPDRFKIDALLAFVATIKVCKPKLFQMLLVTKPGGLKMNEIMANCAFDENIDKESDNYHARLKEIKDFLQFCTSGDEAIQEFKSWEEEIQRFNQSRHELIQYHCNLVSSINFNL